MIISLSEFASIRLCSYGNRRLNQIVWSATREFCCVKRLEMRHRRRNVRISKNKCEIDHMRSWITYKSVLDSAAEGLN